MTVTINGDRAEFPEGTLLPEAIKYFGLELNTAAVVINGVSPMYADYATTELHDGDELKMIHMCIGG